MDTSKEIREAKQNAGKALYIKDAQRYQGWLRKKDLNPHKQSQSLPCNQKER
jgi:hypothetical protein